MPIRLPLCATVNPAAHLWPHLRSHRGDFRVRRVPWSRWCRCWVVLGFECSLKRSRVSECVVQRHLAVATDVQEFGVERVRGPPGFNDQERTPGGPTHERLSWSPARNSEITE